MELFAGETVNIDIIQNIVSNFDLKVEIGGGIRNLNSIQKYIDIGAEKSNFRKRRY